MASLLRLDQFNLTPQAGAHFERDLDFVRQQVLEDRRPPKNAFLLIPQAGDVPDWAETYTHRMVEFIGRAKFIADYADDLPRVDIAGREATFNVKSFGAAYEFSRKEILRSAQGLGLSDKRPRAAREAIEEKFNRIQWYGDPSAGLFGLLNFPYIPRYAMTVAFDGSADPHDVLAELNALSRQPAILTDDTASPNTLLLAPEKYYYVSDTPLREGSDTTILEHFLGTHPGWTVESVNELRGAGPTGGDVAVVYRRDPLNVEHKLVEPFTQLPAQARNLAVVTNCVAQSGGVVSDYPQEMVIGEH